MTHSHPHSALILGAMQSISPDRLQKAVCGLADGTLTVTVTRQTEAEIRGLVRNGDGRTYGITLTQTGAFCSCPDALYRATTCKHAVALALYTLRQPEAKQEEPWSDTSHMLHVMAHPPSTPPPARTIHLVLASGTPLCGVRTPERCWKWPYWPQTAWPETCGECATLRHRPALAMAA
jgi:hypothetical protein